MSSPEEAEKVNNSGAAAGDGSKAATGGNFFVNLLMASSLKKVWSMIEGLQVVCHMPLFNIKSPGNVNAFNDFLADLAFLNIFDTSSFTNDIFYFPEMDPLGLNFANAGFDTSLLIPSLGTLFFMLLGQIQLMLVHLLLICLAKAIPKTTRVRDKVSTYLYWNGSIRFMMEAYIDLCLFTLTNLKELNWREPIFGILASNTLSIILIVLLTVLPIFLIYFFVKNALNWTNVNFLGKYGALLEGTDRKRHTKKWIIVLIPASFFARRITMCLCIVFFDAFLVGQIGVQIIISTLLIILIGWHRPLESAFANNLELFNEIVTMMTLYLMFCFSDWVPDPEARSNCGFAFISVLGLYAAVHIFLLTANMCVKIYQSLRKKYYIRRNRLILAKRLEERQAVRALTTT